MRNKPRPIAPDIELDVCIATRNRPDRLTRTLESLVCQTRPADRIVVCDASNDNQSKDVVSAVCRLQTDAKIQWLASERPSLPFQRRRAFEQSSGDIVLFLDDDVSLESNAIEQLVSLYRQDKEQAIAGVGYLLRENGEPYQDPVRTHWKEYWLGTASYPGGAVTPGGLGTPHVGAGNEQQYSDVSWLKGSAMSFRRNVLLKIFPLPTLERLYQAGLGRAEDLVISRQASRYGRLRLITTFLGTHCDDTATSARPYSTHGWKRGLTGTIGRAHAIKWAAQREQAALGSFLRVAGLELARAIAVLLRHPLSSVGWLQAGGGVYGCLWTLLYWNQIRSNPAQCPTFFPGCHDL